MGTQIFEHAADEIPHVDEGEVGQVVELLHPILRGRAGAAGNMIDVARAGHVDAAMNGRDPGRAGKGMDDPRGAEDREPAENAETRIPGMARHLLALRDRDRDLQIGPAAEPGRHGLDDFGHHAAWHGIDRGLARWDRQARLGDGADAAPGLEAQARVGTERPHARENQRAMRHVGIVARILDDAGGHDVARPLLMGQREGGALALGEHDLDGIGETAGQERLEGGGRRRRGAGARGPAAPQGAVGLTGHGGPGEGQKGSGTWAYLRA